MISTAQLEQRLAELESIRDQLLPQVNATIGAINVVKSLLKVSVVADQPAIEVVESEAESGR